MVYLLIGKGSGALLTRVCVGLTFSLRFLVAWRLDVLCFSKYFYASIQGLVPYDVFYVIPCFVQGFENLLEVFESKHNNYKEYEFWFFTCCKDMILRDAM